MKLTGTFKLRELRVEESIQSCAWLAIGPTGGTAENDAGDGMGVHLSYDETLQLYHALGEILAGETR